MWEAGTRFGDVPFYEVFDVLGDRFHHDGTGFQGAERSMCEALRILVARQIHIPRKDSLNDDQVQTRPQSCVQHSPEWQYQLAVEWRHDPQGTCVGSPDIASHLQTSHKAG